MKDFDFDRHSFATEKKIFQIYIKSNGILYLFIIKFYSDTHLVL